MLTLSRERTDRMARQNVPGTVWKSHGSWRWRVKFPDEKSRRDVVLTFPFSGKRIPAECPQSVAESAAFRLWEARVVRTRPDGTPVFTVNELCDRWLRHAQTYYRHPDGTPTGRAAVNTIHLRALRTLYGNRPVEALAHPDMLALRDHLVGRGLARVTVNGHLTSVRQLFKWALDEALISATAKAELTQVANLRPFRSAARETQPIRAVPDDVVERTCAALPGSLADMVRVHRLTGMRPGEVCGLAWDRIERVGDVWAYRPEHHKNEWRRQVRVVALGPRAQAVLRKYEGAEGCIFSPARTLAERVAELRAARKTPMRPDEDERRRLGRLERGIAPRKVSDRWDVKAYARAVARTCEEEGIERGSPNQLRHTCATAVRRRFGLAAARAVLGHSCGMRVTDRYSFEAAEEEALREASPAMLELG